MGSIRSIKQFAKKKLIIIVFVVSSSCLYSETNNIKQIGINITSPPQRPGTLRQ